MNKGKLEHEVQKECLQVLDLMGIFHWRQNTGSFKTPYGGFFKSSIAGVSDILGIMPDGRFLAVEVKREKGGRVSEEQKIFLDQIRTNHGVAIVTHSAEDLRETLILEIAKYSRIEKEVYRLRDELESYE